MIPSDEVADSPRESGVPALCVARLVALTVMLVMLVSWTTADADLWGHVLFGRDIVATRSLTSVDPYSFTSDRPWINHEWLAEVAMYGAFRAGGPAGLVYLKTFLVSMVIACIVAALRHYRFRSTDHDLLIAVALFGMFPRYHPVRPQLFSLLLFALLLLALAAAGRGHRRFLFGVPLIFGAWANFHGGFLVGLGVLFVWLVTTLVLAPGRWRSLIAVGVASVAATLVTPYGTELWVFLWETVGVSRPQILDWQSPWTLGGPIIIPWALVLMTAVYAVWRAGVGALGATAVAIVAALAVATAKIGRFDAFFAIAVVMLFGPTFASGEKREKERPPWPRWAIVAAILIAVAGTAALTRRASCLEMRGYPEAQALEYLRQREGRVLTLFGWGQYAIWHLSPRLKVSMDGRRETVYSESMIDRHVRLYAGEAGSTSLVHEVSPDLIWLPVASPAVGMLEREGWNAAFRGPISVVLTADPVAVVEAATDALPQQRCFPTY